MLTSPVHVERRHLRVAQVGLQVGVEDAPGDGRLVAAAGEHELALLALHDRGAGVLARRQHAAGRDVGVLQQVEGDEAVVGRGLGVVEDAAQLGQVAGPQEVGDVAHGLAGEQGEGLGLDLEERAHRGLEGGHALGGEQAVRRVVGAEGEQVLVGEVGHGERYPCAAAPHEPDGPRSYVEEMVFTRYS